METAVIRQKQDLTYLEWTRTRGSSGTAGSFLKAFSELQGNRTYYKLSNYDAVRGVVGHESVNELIVDRLLTKLGVPHVPYQLIHADVLVDGKRMETWLCASEDFKRRGESKIALDLLYSMEKTEGETPLAFCERQGWSEFIWQMLMVDFVILNRDRHGANIEILRDSYRKTYRPAPLFDHGVSLLCSCLEEKELREFDVLEDRRVQSFVGSGSTRDNLRLIPGEARTCRGSLAESDRMDLLRDLDGVMPQVWLDKVWEMIWKRWRLYEDFCNQK